MRMRPDQSIVPVVTFHSVGMNHGSWVWNHLSERATMFEGLVKRLRNSGYHTIDLQQLYLHMRGEQICSPKSIVLVFDDGYLDNWVSVVPILKKYEMKGVVYVNPEFVDPRSVVRPTIEDVGPDAMNLSGIDQTGFMSWDELALADNMGVLDVQSHSQTHTWYFSGPEIVDCFLPHNAAKYPWMAWNARPERKPFYLEEDQSEFVRWGTPIFRFEKSLVVRRFIPESEIVQKVVDATNEIERICRTSGPIELSSYKQLVGRVFGNDEFPGVFETDQEYESRVTLELAKSKQMIEEKLNKEVDFLCWPGGGVNNECRRIAVDVGYKSWTLPSNEQQCKRNRPGENPLEIKRLTAMRDVHMLGRRWGRGTDALLFLDILSHQQSVAFNFLRRLYKVGVAFGIAGER